MRRLIVMIAALLAAATGYCRAADDTAVDAVVSKPVTAAIPVQTPDSVPLVPAHQPSEPVAPSFNYRIRPHDTVQVRVFEESDLDTTGRVDKDGNIAFPLLGTANIGGQTVQEATATMETLLHKYLVHPQVAVAILAYTKEHFTILGQVNRPGTYDLPDEAQMDLLEAIGMAGGYTKIANQGKILVKRVIGGQERLLKMDGKKLLNQRYAGDEVPQILPNDTIIVGESVF